MRESPLSRTEKKIIIGYTTVMIGLLVLYAAFGRPKIKQPVLPTTPTCVNTSVVSTPPVTYTDTAGIVVSLASTIKKDDLEGWHLVRIEEAGVQKYAIQFCRSTCALLGYRFQMDEGQEALNKLHSYAQPFPDPKPVTLQAVEQ